MRNGLVFVLLSLPAAAVTLEVALRSVLTLPEARDEYWDRGTFVASDRYGIHMAGHYRGWHARRSVYQVAFTTDGYGFRNAETHAAKSPGTRRIAVLGKSMTFGVGVRDEEVFTRVLEARMRSGNTGPIEVVNLSQPAFGYDMVVDGFAEHIERLDPDLVVFVCATRTNVLLRSDGPFDRMAVVDGLCVARRRPLAGTILDAVRTRTYLGMMLEERLRNAYHGIRRRWNGGSRPFRGAWTRTEPSREERVAAAERVAAEWRTKVVPQLRRLDAICRGHGTPLRLLIIPARRDADYSEERERAVGAVLTSEARDLGWPVTNLHDCLPYRPGSEQSGWYARDNHPTAEGHRIIGRELADVLSRSADTAMYVNGRGKEGLGR